MLSQKSFKSYIHRILKDVHQDTNITKKAVDCIDGFLRTVATNISNSAQLLTSSSDKKTVSVSEVQGAVRILLEERGKDCLDAGENALKRFGNAGDEKSEKPVMRETRAGLILSVSLAEKYLRSFGQSAYNVGGSAPVFLSACLEYLTRELCRLAGNFCHENKKHNITTRHIFLSMTSDSQFRRLSDELGLVILESGVQPFIHDSLVNRQKKQAKKKPATTAGTADKKKTHRFHPGTVTLRRIRSFQRSTELLIQRAPFERVVREITGTKMRFTNEFMFAFQNLIEDRVSRLLCDAICIAVHSNRETVYPADINLVLQLQNFQTRKFELQAHVPIASLRKLALRAGVKRISNETVEHVEQYLFNVVSYYLRSVLICAEHSKRQTVNTRILLESLSLQGVSLATVPEKRRRRRETGKGESNEEEAAVVKAPAKAVAKGRARGRRVAVAAGNEETENAEENEVHTEDEEEFSEED